MARASGYLSRIIQFITNVAEPGILLAAGSGEFHAVIFPEPSTPVNGSFDVKFYDGINNSGKLLVHLIMTQQASFPNDIPFEMQFQDGLFVEKSFNASGGKFIVTYL